MAGVDPVLRRAIRLSAMSVAWGAVIGTVALALAVDTGSLSLAGYGLDAAIDAAASAVLIWRFRVEGREPHRAEEVERLAHRAIGFALLAAGVYVGAQAVRTLAAGSAGPRHSSAAIALSAVSIVALPPLAWAKWTTARRIASRALRSDSMLTAIAALLAGFALLGILLSRWFGASWADPVAALVISAILVREAWDALRSG